jgi:hypothetical protein
MKSLTLLLVIAGPLASGPALTQRTDDPAFLNATFQQAAENAIRNQLRDPDSAKFRERLNYPRK